jgi:hypothetical protein
MCGTSIGRRNGEYDLALGWMANSAPNERCCPRCLEVMLLVRRIPPVDLVPRCSSSSAERVGGRSQKKSRGQRWLTVERAITSDPPRAACPKLPSGKVPLA